jgi:opacity protein-like surface antigen
MRSVRSNLLATAATAIAMCAAAQAADMPAPVIYQPVAVPVQEFGGWYLRGDIGMSNQRVGDLNNVLYGSTAGLQKIDRGFDSAPFFGLGVGYQFNDWLRVDVTGEYRGSANFHGLDIYPGGTDEYRARKYEWTFLANVYADLGTWWCVTPFIGAGVGFSRNTIASFTDTNTVTQGVAFADDTSKTSFAWALYAGLAYKVTPNFTVELAYRYINLGNAQSGDIRTYNGINAIYNPMEFNDLTSHDLKFGVRWALQDSTPGAKPAFYAPPPVSKSYYTPPQQVITAPPQPHYAPPPPRQPHYAPPPVYQQEQPPLMRRG